MAHVGDASCAEAQPLPLRRVTPCVKPVIPLLALLLGACGSARPTGPTSFPCENAPPPRAGSPASTTPAKTVAASPPPTPAPAIDPKRCPFQRLDVEAAPGVLEFRDIAAAKKKLRGGTADHEPVDLAVRAKQSNAFSVELVQDYFHESTSNYSFHDAVFVLKGKVVVVHRLIETVSAIPPPCGRYVQGEVLAVRMMPASGGRHIGHVRVRRADVRDEPTVATSVPPAGDDECGAVGTYRVEDLFIDLDRGEYIAGYGQSYRSPVYERSAVQPTLVPIDKLRITDDGFAIDDARCGEAPWRG